MQRNVSIEHGNICLREKEVIGNKNNNQDIMPKVTIELEAVNCDLCGGSKNKFLYSMPDLRFRRYEQEYSVVECEDCGHRFLSPRPTSESMSLIYPQEYYAERDSSNPKQQKRYLKQAQYLPNIGRGKILDVGCAGGEWLKSIQKHGWECYGADFIKSFHQEQGIDIRYGHLQDIEYPSESFGVVCAWGVMEHVYEPSKYFRSIHRLLKAGGIFIFMVPNGDSLWSRWAYKEDIPRHLHFFRTKILRLYAQKYGYAIQKIEYTNYIYSRPATGRGLFKRRILRKAGVCWEEIVSSPHNLALKLLGIAAGVFDYCLIYPKLEELFGLCGNMVVIFEKTDKGKT